MSSLYAEEIKRVKDLLEVMGRGAKRSLGQNFLINSQKIDLIIKQLHLNSWNRLIEVGPGLGALTRRLKEVDPNTQLIEMDEQFAAYWKSQDFKVIVVDALKLDWHQLGLTDATLISNLPYQIAARLVVERCVDPCGVTSMILMFQKEVAQRLTAKIKTEHYSLLSVVAQSFWQMENLTDLGPNDYYPPPKVASRVVIFRRRDKDIPHRPQNFLDFVKLSFSQKRKYLKKALSGRFGEAVVLEAFQKLSISPQARPEELDVLTFQRLYQILDP